MLIKSAAKVLQFPVTLCRIKMDVYKNLKRNFKPQLKIPF